MGATYHFMTLHGHGCHMGMGATYLIVALLRIDTKSYPQCSNEVRGTYIRQTFCRRVAP